jgi:choline-sulfatase
MKPSNVLFILSDEHQRGAAGCYGNRLVQTPNLDRLAQRGARFDNAYTPSPICVPARASLATGEWVHQGGYWDNVFTFHGQRPSWHRRLRDRGHEVVAIGKLHFRSAADDNGFTKEILTMHIKEGTGDLIGSIRNPPPPPRPAMPALAAGSGPGECTYNDYDVDVAAEACNWLKNRASSSSDKPWVLMVSFVRPHYPLTAPAEFFDLYSRIEFPLPRLYKRGERPSHPAVRELSGTINYGDYFKDDAHIRQAIASYYALVTFLDHQIGRVLDALAEVGLTDKTRVIYSSDHGDNLGTRGLWGKSVMYEESAAVPFIAAGPDIPTGKTVQTPVSLIDIYRSVIEAVGAEQHPDDANLPSRSIWQYLHHEDLDRTMFSEYHAMGSRAAWFMIRHSRWKYIYYVGHGPELFDLETDPGETKNLADNGAYAQILAECESKLREICDPEEVNARAFRDQERRLAEHGGAAAILARGDILYTPIPGEPPKLYG